MIFSKEPIRQKYEELNILKLHKLKKKVRDVDSRRFYIKRTLVRRPGFNLCEVAVFFAKIFPLKKYMATHKSCDIFQTCERFRHIHIICHYHNYDKNDRLIKLKKRKKYNIYKKNKLSIILISRLRILSRFLCLLVTRNPPSKHHFDIR